MDADDLTLTTWAGLAGAGFVSAAISVIYTRMSSKSRARYAAEASVVAKFDSGVFSFNLAGLPAPERTIFANWTSVSRNENWIEARFGAEIDGCLEAVLVVMFSSSAFEQAFYRTVNGLVTALESAGHAPIQPADVKADGPQPRKAVFWANWAPIAFAEDLASIFFYRISPHVMRRLKDAGSVTLKPDAAKELIVPEFEVLMPAPTLLGFLKNVRDTIYDGRKYEETPPQA